MIDVSKLSNTNIPAMSNIVVNTDASLAAALHDKGREYLNHFSSIKFQYKKLAITWLIAVFLALAFIASNQEQQIHINKLYLISLITLLALIGIRFLQFLDLNVYHTQLKALFLGMILLEEKNSSLCKPYTNMAKLLHKKYFDPILVDSLYYGIISFVIAILGVVTLYLKLSQNHPILGTVVAFGVIILFILWEALSAIFSMRHGGSRFQNQS